MSDSISDLLAQREALDRQIRAVRSEEKATSLARIRELMAEFNLTPADIQSAPRAKASSSDRKVAPKYRDPVSGTTWSGRGLKPKWLEAALDGGNSLQDYAIRPDA